MQFRHSSPAKETRRSDCRCSYGVRGRSQHLRTTETALMGVLDVLMENIFLYPLANPAVSTKEAWNLVRKSLRGHALRA